MQDAYPGVLGVHEGHTTKSCCPLGLRLTLNLAEVCKILCLDPSLLYASFTDAVPSTI